MKNILIATDGTAGARAAVDEGLALAAALGAAATFVSVRKSPLNVLGDPYYARLVSRTLHHSQADVDDALAQARAAGVSATAEILEGDPADEIVSLADNRDVDLIVVGSRGAGPIAGAVVGSVSAAVVRHANRPVVVVKAQRRAGARKAA